jgi:acylphosphatase
MAGTKLGNDEWVTLSARVRGHVQGVGFRVFIRTVAWQLGVRGYARNLPDGTVQVVAAGKRDGLDRLLQEVWRGPAGAHVMGVDAEWSEGKSADLPSQFEVRG